MKDYDIKIRNGSEIKVYGTNNDTIVVPSKVKFDTARGHADIDIKDVSDVIIGLPNEVEDIELNVSNAALTIENITFEKMGIDAKGDIKISVNNLTGNIDVNMVGGTCELYVPSSYGFKTVCEGKGNTIDLNGVMPDEGSSNVIELNGKNSVLKIIAVN